MTISWSFSYNAFVKLPGKQKLEATTRPCYIHISVITSCVIKRLYSIYIASKVAILLLFFRNMERSGLVVECLTRDRGFEPHRRHCVMVLEQDTFILA